MSLNYLFKKMDRKIKYKAISNLVIRRTEFLINYAIK